MGQPLSRQRPHDGGGPSSATSRSEQSVRALARRYGISPTTVQKWRKRQTTADMPMEPAMAYRRRLGIAQQILARAGGLAGGSDALLLPCPCSGWRS